MEGKAEGHIIGVGFFLLETRSTPMFSGLYFSKYSTSVHISCSGLHVETATAPRLREPQLQWRAVEDRLQIDLSHASDTKLTFAYRHCAESCKRLGKLVLSSTK